MAMNRFLRCFCINRFGMGPLHYHSSRSDFGFEFVEILVFKKRLPAINDAGSRRLRVSVILGVADSPYQWYAESLTPPYLWYGESAIKFFNRKLSVAVIRRVVDSPHQWYGEWRWVAGSPYPWVGESATPPITTMLLAVANTTALLVLCCGCFYCTVQNACNNRDLKNYRKEKMAMIMCSPHRWYGESATPHISESESRRLRVSAIRGVDNSAYQWYGESPTLRMGDWEVAVKILFEKLPVSPIRGVVNSLHHWYGES